MWLFKPNVEKMRVKGDVDGLLKALTHRVSGVRQAAADALGTMGDRRAVEPLSAALKDASLGVRAAAADALEKIRLSPTTTSVTHSHIPQGGQQAYPSVSTNAKLPKEHLRNIMSIAMKADWHSPNDMERLLKAIKNTWEVDCKIVRLTEQQVQEVEEQYPLDTEFEDISQQYHIRLSSNSIFIHEHGAWINFGYLKFLYHDRIYYVNVAPMVNMTASVFSRMDDLSHMAKIMITLGERRRDDRTPFVIYLEGDLAQNE